MTASPDPINWGAPKLAITRTQQLYAAKRVEDWLIAHPDIDNLTGLTRDDLVVLIRATRGYYRDGTTS